MDSPAYVALGSNVGDRETMVLRAARALEREGVAQLLRMSSLYETEPIACGPMDNFVNAVVEVRPLLWPEDLLSRIQMLEKQLGRRGAHNEPRTVDIDIVAMGNRVLDTQHLRIPHPRYATRAFVLIPLQEIAPGFTCPVTGRGVSDMIGALLEPQRVTRISGRGVVFRQPRCKVTNHV
jgi:2-amino-4-hydroxy-6-hydroxymethyldihydropteridine diphosphokinase